MPSSAFAVFDQKTARLIVQLADFAHEHGLLRVEKLDDRVKFHLDPFDNEEDGRIGIDRGPDDNEYLGIVGSVLVVDQNEYWFEAEASKFEIEVNTNPESVDALATEFGIARTLPYSDESAPSPT
jgi:hypothetical protein